MARESFDPNTDQPASAYPGGNAPWQGTSPSYTPSYEWPAGTEIPGGGVGTGGGGGGGAPAPAAPTPAAGTVGTPAPGGGTNAGSGPYAPSSVIVGANQNLFVWQEKYDAQTGSRTYGFVDMGNPAAPGFSWASVATASGIPVGVLQAQYVQGAKQLTQQGNGQLRNKNPDGTYSVLMPDGSVQNKSLQDLAGIPGISAGDIASADKDFVYSAMRAKEADWMGQGVQLYGAGQGPGAFTATMDPGVQASSPAGSTAQYAPMPDTRPGGTPIAGAAPAPMPSDRSAGTAPIAGGAPMPDTRTGGTSMVGAATAPAQAQTQGSTQGATVATSMLPMQSAMSSSASGGATTAAVGNYGNSNGSNQDYELATQGLQDQYNRGNMTYNLGSSSYTNPGETRQQYSQRINDLQNQYNMSQSTFNLSHQAQAQANTAQEQAVTASKNQLMGQSRSISGMGLGSLPQARVTGLS